MCIRNRSLSLTAPKEWILPNYMMTHRPSNSLVKPCGREHCSGTPRLLPNRTVRWQMCVFLTTKFALLTQHRKLIQSFPTLYQYDYIWSKFLIDRIWLVCLDIFIDKFGFWSLVLLFSVCSIICFVLFFCLLF